MKNLSELDAYRRADADVIRLFGWTGDETCGVFDLPCPRTGVTLTCIASTGEGWDHVSVSLKNRCPNWTEMEHAKRAFFLPDETAMQLHVPEADHISFAHTALHLWRPQRVLIPRPPAALVGAPRSRTAA
jgi:hypothetical protein